MCAADSPSGEMGRILSQNREPVPFAAVVNQRSGIWSTANEAGVFWIPNGTVIGDSLRVERIGYQGKSIVYSGGFLAMQLVNDPIHFPEITIHEKPTRDYIIPVTGMTRNELVNSLPGTVLRSYGGSAGIAQAAVEGGRTADVKVVFNGIDLTSPQNGLTDLSQIPIQHLGYGALNQNINLKFGSGSTDGIIQINPWLHPTGVQYQVGLDGTSSLSAHFELDHEVSAIRITTGKNSNPGTHPVLYKSKSVERTNQDFGQSFFGLQLELKKGNWLTEGSIWHSTQERGISGLIWSPNTNAFRKDTLSLVSGSMVRLFPRGFLQSSVTYRKSGENYVDSILSIDSDHAAETILITVTGLIVPNTNTVIRFHSGLAQERVISTDAGNHLRKRFFLGASISLAHFAGFTVLPALRLDHYSDFGSALTYSGKLTKEISHRLEIAGDLGSSFRAPTFNDLHWNPGGNPNLRPEWSTFGKISAQFTFSKASFELQYKNSAANNLIVWQPTGDYWQPENVDKTTRKIWGFNGQISISDQVSIHGALRNIYSINTNTNLELRYSPNWIGTIRSQISNRDWTSTLSFHFTGQQIVMYDYPNNLTMDPTLMSHFLLEMPPIFDNQIRLNLSVSNLLNREIMTIYGYPEPSRTIRAKISYQLNQKVKK